MVVVGTGRIGTRFLNKDWPIEEGLEAGTTKLSTEPSLEPEKSFIPRKEKVDI